MASSETEHVRRLYRAIYAVVRSIPRGRIATYGQVAELAGIPGGARIAGAAMRTSKPTDRVPWQRVLGKAGKTRARIAILDPVGAAIQRQLLEHEQVTVAESGHVDLAVFGWLPARTTRRARATARAGSSRAASPRRRPRSGSTSRASSSRR